MIPEVFPIDSLNIANSIEPFLGEWELVPDSCRYEYGNPPATAVAHIGHQEDCLVMTTEWVSDSGRWYTLVLQGVPDGKERVYENPIVADTFCINVDGRTLQAVARRNGRVVSHTTRTLSLDGSSLAVTQRGLKPDGLPYTNSLVYRRA